jgi:hypothetical protein
MIMNRLQALQQANPGLEILPISDPVYNRYGRILTGLDAEAEIRYSRSKASIGEGVVYEAAVPGLEQAGGLLATLTEKHYGEMPVQLGWCYGRNLSLDGLEYHKGSEIDVAVTDCVLMLAHYDDIHWDERPWLDSASVKFFYVPAGTVFELYAWGLHFAPQHVSEADGFCTLVALPRETNFPLDRKPEGAGEAGLLFGRNKWLLVHPEAEGLVRGGAFVGIQGKNLKLTAIP